MCPSEVRVQSKIKKINKMPCGKAPSWNYRITTILEDTHNYSVDPPVAARPCAGIWRTCSPQCTLPVLGALLRPYLMGFPQCCLISSAVGPCCTTVSKSTMGGQTTRQRWATGPARRRASFEEGCFMPAGRPVTAEQPWGLGHWLLSLRLRVWWELGVCERHEGPGMWPGQADFTINL